MFVLFIWSCNHLKDLYSLSTIDSCFQSLWLSSYLFIQKSESSSLMIAYNIYSISLNLLISFIQKFETSNVMIAYNIHSIVLNFWFPNFWFAPFRECLKTLLFDHGFIVSSQEFPVRSTSASPSSTSDMQIVNNNCTIPVS